MRQASRLRFRQCADARSEGVTESLADRRTLWIEFSDAPKSPPPAPRPIDVRLERTDRQLEGSPISLAQRPCVAQLRARLLEPYDDE